MLLCYQSSTKKIALDGLVNMHVEQLSNGAWLFSQMKNRSTSMTLTVLTTIAMACVGNKRFHRVDKFVVEG